MAKKQDQFSVGQPAEDAPETKEPTTFKLTANTRVMCKHVVNGETRAFNVMLRAGKKYTVVDGLNIPVYATALQVSREWFDENAGILPLKK